MTMTSVEVRLREQTPPPVTETIDETLSRLRSLERAGAIAELRVESWGPRERAVTDGSTDRPTIASLVDDFREWANRNDYSLGPAYERREVSSMFCERSHVQHVVPILAIAVYEDDALQCVAPCADDDCAYTVHDCIDAIERGSDGFDGLDAVSSDQEPVSEDDSVAATGRP